MRTRTAARVMAAVLLVLAGSVGGYLAESRRSSLGKEAFLASQTKRFESTYSLGPESYFVGGAVAVVGFIGVYELLACGIYAVIRPREDRAA